MPKRIDNKVMYSFDEIYSTIQKLSEKILADPRISKNGGTIDMIIAISTGGWIPARCLKTFLPHNPLEKFPLRMYPLGIVNYDNENNLLSEPQIYYDLPKMATENIPQKNVLVIDEVVDSGHSLELAYSYIGSYNPKSLYFAVIHKKERSVFNPDFVGEECGNEWIVYPWDIIPK
jgi:hypoxanthine phosphoribosyltransferase